MYTACQVLGHISTIHSVYTGFLQFLWKSAEWKYNIGLLYLTCYIQSDRIKMCYKVQTQYGLHFLLQICSNLRSHHICCWEHNLRDQPHLLLRKHLLDQVLVAIQFAPVFQSPCPSIDTSHWICAGWVALEV